MKFLLVVFINLSSNNQLIHHFGVPYDTLQACESAPGWCKTPSGIRFARLVRPMPAT